MPKVKINNTQGLVQASGGGIALFGATETVAGHASAASAQIAETSSLVFATSSAGSQYIGLPATTNLETGHTIVIVHSSGSDNLAIAPDPVTHNINGVNGSGHAEIVLTAKTAVTCIWSGATDPGWIVLVGDAATVPA